MTVAQRLATFNVTTPAGTAIATPLVSLLNLGDVRLDEVTCRFPPGPSGLVGVSIVQSGTQLWPYGSTSWIIAEDETIGPDPIGTEIDNGVAVVTYNLDTFNHTLYFRLSYTPISLVAVAPPIATPVAVTSPTAPVSAGPPPPGPSPMGPPPPGPAS